MKAAQKNAPLCDECEDAGTVETCIDGCDVETYCNACDLGRDASDDNERDFLAHPGSPPAGFTPEQVRRAKAGMDMARRRLGVA